MRGAPTQVRNRAYEICYVVSFCHYCFIGSVYIFVTYDGGYTWSEVQTLLASDGAGEDRFGVSLAVYNGVVIVAAYGDDNEKGANAGFIALLGL